MLGVSNQYLARFQKPYSFEAESEPTIEIIDAHLSSLILYRNPSIRNQFGTSCRRVKAAVLVFRFLKLLPHPICYTGGLPPSFLLLAVDAGKRTARGTGTRYLCYI